MKKHLYLIADHPDEDVIGNIDFRDEPDGPGKNEEGHLQAFNKEEHAFFDYDVVGLGSYEFIDKDDLRDRAGDVIGMRLGEIDEEYRELTDIEPSATAAN